MALCLCQLLLLVDGVLFFMFWVGFLVLLVELLQVASFFVSFRLFASPCVFLRLQMSLFDLTDSFRITTAKTYSERKNLETEPGFSA